ncbi:MAG: hypothetical protein AAFY59_02250 [Pseudomonadota bacterium]
MQTKPLSTWKLFLRNWGWMAAFPMLFAVIFGLVAMFEGRKAERLAAEGVDGVALITNKDVEVSYDSDGDRRTTYRVYFTIDPNGREHADDDTVGRRFYNSVKVGEEVPVRYWAPDPDVNEIEPGSTGTTIWITKIVSAVTLTIALAWGYFAWEKGAKAVRMRERGVRRRARVTGLKITNVSVNKRKLVRLMWLDEEGVEGASFMARREKFERWPEGSEVWVYADRAGRRPSVWEGDVGPARGEPSVRR